MDHKNLTTMSFVYLESTANPGKFHVGFFAPSGDWFIESTHDTKGAAIEWMRFLNGGLDLDAIETALQEIDRTLLEINTSIRLHK